MAPKVTSDEIFKLLSNIKQYTYEERNDILYQYRIFPRSTESVRMLNKDLRTIEYDNIEENITYINNMSVSKNFMKSSFLFINNLIEFNKMFYVSACNKPTWVRFNKDLLPLTYKYKLLNIEIPPMYFVYNTYYLLKMALITLNSMIAPINFMFSDKCKNKKILNHPSYHKGLQYFLTAIDANITMINELIFINGLVIKGFGLYYKNMPDSLKMTPEASINITNQYNYLLSINQNLKKKVDTKSVDMYPKLFKTNNTNLYIMILDILKPFNFLNLFVSILKYQETFKVNMYLHRLINKIDNPDFLGDHFTTMTPDIE
jgi:hypothetical protein